MGARVWDLFFISVWIFFLSVCVCVILWEPKYIADHLGDEIEICRSNCSITELLAKLQCDKILRFHFITWEPNFAWFSSGWIMGRHNHFLDNLSKSFVLLKNYIQLYYYIASSFINKKAKAVTLSLHKDAVCMDTGNRLLHIQFLKI